MNWINSLISIYLVVAICLFFRYLNIAVKVRDGWHEQDIEFKVSDYISRMIGDSVLWPVYIIWYGLKEFIKELK